MKRIISLIYILIAVQSLLSAEDWAFTAIISGNYNGTEVSKNWSGDERSGRSWFVNSEASAEKDITSLNLYNSVKLEYGRSEIEGDSYIENADAVDLESILSYKLDRDLNPYVSLRYESQFTDFSDPAVYSESAGAAMILAKADNYELKMRIGASARQTVISGEDINYDSGPEVICNYDIKSGDKFKYISELKVFTSFESGNDLEWDNNIYYKLYKYLTANVSYRMVDSEEFGPEFLDNLESRLTLSLGISYNVF